MDDGKAEQMVALGWEVAEAVAGVMGAEALAPLGYGMQGVAYALEDGDVLKLTWDSNEAAIAAALLAGKVDDHGTLPAIRDIAAFEIAGGTAYALIREQAHGLDDGCVPGDADVLALTQAWSQVTYGLWWDQPFTVAAAALAMRPMFAGAQAFVEGLQRMKADKIAIPADLKFENIGEAAGGRLVVRDFGRFEVNRRDFVRPWLEAVPVLHLQNGLRP